MGGASVLESPTYFSYFLPVLLLGLDAFRYARKKLQRRKGNHKIWRQVLWIPLSGPKLKKVVT